MGVGVAVCVWGCIPPHSPDPLEYFDREVQKRRDQETNLWSEPGDPSHSERDDDRALYGLLQARGKTRTGSTVGDREGEGERGECHVIGLFFYFFFSA